MIASKKTNITVSNLNIGPDADPEGMDVVSHIFSNLMQIRRGARVLIKPNLAFPRYLPGVCTNKLVLEWICSILRDWNCHIMICEGDGGIAAFSAQQAFEGNGLKDLVARFQVHFISLSTAARKPITQSVANKEITFKLPQFLLDRDFDWFINVPVLKAHLYTRLSLSMKNLWGCIPDPFRIHYHYLLHHGIVALWKSIKPDLSIIDGTIALDGNGPLNGKPIPMNVILAGAGDASVDRVGAKLMGIDFDSVKHLKLAEHEGLIQAWENITLSQSLEPFCQHNFKAQRGLTDWGGVILSKSPTVQKIVYHSRATQIICKILFRIRKNNVQNTLRRYGEPDWGKGCGTSEFCDELGTTD